MERAEDDVGESGGEGNGIFKVVDGEVILAGLDGGLIEVLEGAVGVEGMKLFLGLDGCDSGEDGVDGVLITVVVAVDFVGDVEDELGEEGDFGELVEGDEFEAGQGVASDVCRWRAIGEAAMCRLLNACELAGGVGDVGEPIRQREFEGCGGNE